ncbi:MAG TPA: hypothetical protein DDY58_18310 [Terrisporobacter glycolicus]|uniref:hypothetical protein n=1 Tax=Terrisporobacter TaxID=1505652 RepID=UPI000E815F9B|nr:MULTISPECIES: hypothetical protein [Terrisporobacter]HBI94209.1 hypothetical protein [Terrisporobacter hibernicus]
MKELYEKPIVNIQEFALNQRIATCNDSIGISGDITSPIRWEDIPCRAGDNGHRLKEESKRGVTVFVNSINCQDCYTNLNTFFYDWCKYYGNQSHGSSDQHGLNATLDEAFNS